MSKIPKAGKLLQVEDTFALWTSTSGFSQLGVPQQEQGLLKLLTTAGQMPSGDIFSGSSLPEPILHAQSFIRCSVVTVLCKDLVKGKHDTADESERVVFLARSTPVHDAALCSRSCGEIRAALGLEWSSIQISGTLVQDRPERRGRFAFDASADFSGLYALTPGFEEGIFTHEPRPARRAVSLDESGSQQLTADTANKGGLLLCPGYLRPTMVTPPPAKGRSGIAFNVVVARGSAGLPTQAARDEL